MFRDTKEGGLVSVRVASSMDVRNGGAIRNGYGGTNEEETWGKHAPWCDYSGMVDGKHVGVAIMDHETNPRYPTQWHVRDYGLMTANCFAWKHYCPEARRKGGYDVQEGGGDQLALPSLHPQRECRFGQSSRSFFTTTSRRLR